MMMNSLLNEDNDGYAWEGDYEQTWTAIEEDERGRLRTTLANSLYRTRKKQMLEKQTNIRLSMLRHMYIVVDTSICMVEKDLKPSRILCILKLLEKFIFSFFDQNPISQVGVLITRNKTTEKFCDLMGNPRYHWSCFQIVPTLVIISIYFVCYFFFISRKIVDKLKTISEKYCQGEPSMQNSLEMSMQYLKHLKSHSSREVLFVMGSLSTCDPGDVFQTISQCKSLGVRCSVIGLSAEVHLFRYLSEQTLGGFRFLTD
jgi:transcription initiation factor TFIIH subunit 2